MHRIQNMKTFRLLSLVSTVGIGNLMFPTTSMSEPKKERRVVLVTGGSRGIGKAISKGFAAQGDQVVINYSSNRAAAEETLAELAGEGHCIIQCDVSDGDACLQMVDTIASKYKRLDVLGGLHVCFTHLALSRHTYPSYSYVCYKKLK